MRYEVILERVVIYSASVEIDADNFAEAEDKATAESINWREETDTIQVIETNQLETEQ